MIKILLILLPIIFPLSLLSDEPAKEPEKDLYTYTNVICRPDLEYLQVDSVTIDLNDSAIKITPYYTRKQLDYMWHPIPKDLYNVAKTEENIYLTERQTASLMREKGMVPYYDMDWSGGKMYSEEIRNLLKESGLVEVRNPLSRDEFIDYLKTRFNKGLKAPYECKFKDKTVTVKEIVTPDQKDKCGNPRVDLRMFLEDEMLAKEAHFLACNGTRVSYIYNNLGGFTSCYQKGKTRVCVFEEIHYTIKSYKQ